MSKELTTLPPQAQELISLISKSMGKELALKRDLKKQEESTKTFKTELRRWMKKLGISKWELDTGWKFTDVPDTPDHEETETEIDWEAMQVLEPEAYKICKSFEVTKTKTVKGRSGYLRVTPPKEQK